MIDETVIFIQCGFGNIYDVIKKHFVNNYMGLSHSNGLES
jgi:hypothetical protein